MSRQKRDRAQLHCRVSRETLQWLEDTAIKFGLTHKIQNGVKPLYGETLDALICLIKAIELGNLPPQDWCEHQSFKTALPNKHKNL